MRKSILKINGNVQSGALLRKSESTGSINKRQSLMSRRGSAHGNKENHRSFNLNNSKSDIHNKNIELSIDDTSSEYNCYHRSTKVIFTEITIYEFPNILGDNPGTSNGSPITIGWHHHSKNSLDVDFYEYMRSSSAACNPRRNRRQLFIRGGDRDTYLLGIGYRLDELMDATDEVRKIRESRARNMKDTKWMKIVGVLDTVGKGVVNTTVDVGKGVFDVSKIIVIDGILDGSVQVAKGTTKAALTTSSFVAQGAISTTNFVTQGAITVVSAATGVPMQNRRTAMSA